MKQFYLHFSYKKVVKDSNKENWKVTKNTLPSKSINPESLTKWQLEWSSSNVHMVCEDLLRAFYKLSSLRFCVSSDQ